MYIYTVQGARKETTNKTVLRACRATQTGLYTKELAQQKDSFDTSVTICRTTKIPEKSMDIGTYYTSAGGGKEPADHFSL